jgi:membrane dipeptidase
VIREMNRLGMMVDIAHVADKTFWDVLETSTAPIFSSHSSCRALSNVTRNMTDQMITAMAKKGGQININFACDFLSQRSADTSPMRRPEVRQKIAELNATVADPAERRAKIRELTRGMKIERATIADVVANINHAVKLAGIDHVGIGSDFDGVGCTPVGLDDTSKWMNLTRALLEAGYSRTDVHKILGGNMLRFMRAVEAVRRAAAGS